MKLSLTEKLKRVVHQNTNSSYVEISKFILINKDLEWGNVTIFSFAKKNNISAPTITRFCKSIGLSGYKELTYLMKNNESEIIGKIDRGVLRIDDSDRINIFKNNVIESIEACFENNKGKYEKISKKILNANKIYFFGLGSNRYLIKVFSDLLVRLNLNVIFSKSIEQQLAYLNNVTKDDLVIIVSISLSDPMFDFIAETLEKIQNSPFYFTKRLNAKALHNIPADNIFTISTSENSVGINFQGEISLLFILKSILLFLIDNDTYKSINIANI